MVTISISLPHPQQQIDYQLILENVRTEFLQDALLETVKKINLAKLDEELNKYVPAANLTELAGRGLRGEMLYPVPYLLESNPKLLAYYRLLLGYSQKAFYTSETGMNVFASMEKKGTITPKQISLLPQACKAMIASASDLVTGIGLSKVTRDLFDDLTLLTLGPNMRGSSNVSKGNEAIEQVKSVIKDIVKKAIVQETNKKLVLKNAAKRAVIITFGSDPDVTFQEEMGTDDTRNLLAIEVKGGDDISNIHNRIGEAEKSHLKAFKSGYLDFWTIVNVKRLDPEIAQEQSPTTRRFYSLANLLSKKSNEYIDLQKRIIGLTGIK